MYTLDAVPEQWNVSPAYEADEADLWELWQEVPQRFYRKDARYRKHQAVHLQLTEYETNDCAQDELYKICRDRRALFVFHQR